MNAVPTATTPVIAAGAVCWRIVDGDARILLVHRTQHRDVSLPKGKVDPGETLPQTAVREIAEETGLTIVLGAPLGQISYVLPNGRDKLVYYWSAEVDGNTLEASRFTPNDEIDALEWVSLAKARKRLSYPHDIEVVDAFAERLAAGNARTFAIIALRHGKAVPAESWDGPDATRPLLQRGVDQAASIAMGIAAFRPARLTSSTAVRCVQTLAPTARLTGLPVRETAKISQDAWEDDTASVSSVVAKRLRRMQTAVLCSHGPVLPAIIDEVARQTNTVVTSALRAAARLSTGEYTVLHISAEHPDAGIVAIETHSPTAE
ncbi:MAG: 8-oxo-(d)GTP phosphatase [Actinomycetota bacterium]|jgi:8-oxo-dGTP diphosphatase|nr:8-oxo-(d)GTP phosphatase [Actinomycetota bacterium]